MTRLSYVPATAIVVRRAALEELGGFAEDLPLRRGRRPRVAPGRGRPPRAVRPAFGGPPRAPPVVGRLDPPALRLRDLGGAPGGPPPGRAGAGGRVRLERAGVGPGGGPPPGRRAGRRRRHHRPPRPQAVRPGGRGGARPCAWACSATSTPDEALAQAVTRAWLPLACGAAVPSRTARRALLGAVAARTLVGDGGRPAHRLLRLVDDAAYCAGVWAGCWRARTAEPLRPALGSWPGRTPVPEPSRTR